MRCVIPFRLSALVLILVAIGLLYPTGKGKGLPAMELPIRWIV
jgi:hypothetical protein